MEIAICNDTMIVTEWLGFFNFFCTRTNAYVLVNDKKKKRCNLEEKQTDYVKNVLLAQNDCSNEISVPFYVQECI